MKKIGFIGVGNMGGPMARNLKTAGHTVTAFDLSAESLAALAADGIHSASSAAEAVKDADIIFTMLPAGKHVAGVYQTDVFGKANAEAILIDCSTIDVKTSREVHADALTRGYKMLDAPVSGGVGGASAGTLTFMVGGPESVLEASRDLFEVMGANIVYCGDAGAGQAAKMCNNMMLGAQMVSVAEAFILAEKLGLDHQKLFDVASTASGQCWSLTTYCPVPGPVPTSPANNGYAAGFAAAMMLKDLNLAMGAAQETNTQLSLAKEATRLYKNFAENASDDTDFSGIIEMLRQQNTELI